MGDKLRADIFFGAVRETPFYGVLHQISVDGINSILAAFDVAKVTDIRDRAYMLATVFHETGRTMQPIAEYGRGKGHSYGLEAGPWHQNYYGRGYVQLTWLANYQRATMELRALDLIGDDIDFVKNPELVMKPEYAAPIMIRGMLDGWFTGKKLADFITPSKTDYLGARAIINGHDKAGEIATYARQFHKGLALSI